MRARSNFKKMVKRNLYRVGPDLLESTIKKYYFLGEKLIRVATLSYVSWSSKMRVLSETSIDSLGFRRVCSRCTSTRNISWIWMTNHGLQRVHLLHVYSRNYQPLGPSPKDRTRNPPQAFPAGCWMFMENLRKKE
jgi:hypothetical protein